MIPVQGHRRYLTYGFAISVWMEKNPYVVITGKGAKTRNVPIMEKTCKHLKSYLHRFHIEDNPEEYLFYIERKGIRSQMSIDNVEKFVARYGKKSTGDFNRCARASISPYVETFTCDAFV